MSYVHKKTWNLYDVLVVGVEATNSREDERVVIYWRKCWWTWIVKALLTKQMVFVREKKEFKDKFYNEVDGV